MELTNEEKTLLLKAATLGSTQIRSLEIKDEVLRIIDKVRS